MTTADLGISRKDIHQAWLSRLTPAGVFEVARPAGDRVRRDEDLAMRHEGLANYV